MPVGPRTELPRLSTASGSREGKGRPIQRRRSSKKKDLEAQKETTIAALGIQDRVETGAILRSHRHDLEVAEDSVNPCLLARCLPASSFSKSAGQWPWISRNSPDPRFHNVLLASSEAQIESSPIPSQPGKLVAVSSCRSDRRFGCVPAGPPESAMASFCALLSLSATAHMGPALCPDPGSDQLDRALPEPSICSE